LDRILRSIPEAGKEWLSRQAWDWLLENGRVKRNGRAIKKGGETIPSGETITVEFPSETLGLLTANSSTNLLWINPDKEWALFLKDPGVPSLPLFPWMKDSFVNQVMHFLKGYDAQLSQKFAALSDPPSLEGGLVQRLDTDTSGLLTVAFTKEAKSRFRKVFSDHEAERTYLAIVQGESAFQDREFTFQLDVKDRAKVRVLAKEYERAELEKCVLSFTTLSASESHSLVRVKTRYGQRHLVRVCLAELGHPLLGDALYGDGKGASFHQLHAASLTFLPKDLPANTFHAPAPKSFLDCLKDCGLEYLA
jgi:23S rRNA-/tRNA-specific pseudouridylate synthase